MWNNTVKDKKFSLTSHFKKIFFIDLLTFVFFVCFVFLFMWDRFAWLSCDKSNTYRIMLVNQVKTIRGKIIIRIDWSRPSLIYNILDDLAAVTQQQVKPSSKQTSGGKNFKQKRVKRSTNSKCLWSRAMQLYSPSQSMSKQYHSLNK